MLASIHFNSKIYNIDLSKPLDLSIPLRGEVTNVNAWNIEHPKITPHTEGEFIGKVSEGASTNFYDIWFNPHAHGTHTECVGHITKKFHSVNQSLERYFFLTKVVTIAPGKLEGDFVISKKQIQNALGSDTTEAVVIRTLPNTKEKFSKQYSLTNPPYLLEEAAQFLKERGVEHLLVDLPSVDKEKDEGKLLAHKAFWNMGGKKRLTATITEFVFVDNTIQDGTYFMNLQMASMENDASPSRPVLYRIIE